MPHVKADIEIAAAAAVILMVWPHLESLKMIERLQGKPVVMCSIMDLVHYFDTIDDDEKYKLDLPWIDQTSKSPAGHGLVSPKGEQPKSSRRDIAWRMDKDMGESQMCSVVFDGSARHRCKFAKLQIHPSAWPNSMENLPLFWKNISSEYSCTGRQPHIYSSLKPLASDNMVRVHERGGGSSTPISTPSNNRARSVRNRNGY
ncbi:hypothetical protein T12_15153 [Trichinella patagoniensis]|uniref:Uncharacterized protein n=1 Tax=Trichinella patagoniensis TaxID=990121 RepID=A0A0V0ZVZ0_9BILA|nr:hypothetical protein T12_15153 [Trichinella patagoniensis]